jgi:hypothetical protein
LKINYTFVWVTPNPLKGAYVSLKMKFIVPLYGRRGRTIREKNTPTPKGALMRMRRYKNN